MDAFKIDVTHANVVHMARTEAIWHGRWRHCARLAVMGVGIESASVAFVGVVSVVVEDTSSKGARVGFVTSSGFCASDSVVVSE